LYDEQWLRFKDQIQEGDEIWYYKTRSRRGPSGFHCVVARVMCLSATTRLSMRFCYRSVDDEAQRLI
jgi:hypothetical protein